MDFEFWTSARGQILSTHRIRLVGDGRVYPLRTGGGLQWHTMCATPPESRILLISSVPRGLTSELAHLRMVLRVAVVECWPSSFQNVENSLVDCRVRELIEGKKRELAAHDLTRPADVARPVEGEATRAATEAAEAQLAELSKQIETLRDQINTSKSVLALANRRTAAADRLLTRLTSFEAGARLVTGRNACATRSPTGRAGWGLVLDGWIFSGARD